jgi:hypothetical protein
VNPQATAAIVAAAVSTVGGIIGVVIQLAMARRERLRKEAQEEQDRQERAEEVRSRYRDPLLNSAWALQSRIYNIVAKAMFGQPAENAPRRNGRSYAQESTLYVLAEFLGWLEILRREVQFLDLGDEEHTKRINRVLYGIRDLIAQNDPRFGSAFRLFRIEQRAVGELMIESVTVGKESRFQCIGPAAFASRLDTAEFRQWFEQVENSLTELVLAQRGAFARLALLQNWILVFMSLLDPHGVNLAGSRRALPVPEEFTAFTPAARLSREMPGEPLRGTMELARVDAAGDGLLKWR